jgi:hypothetical protein
MSADGASVSWPQLAVNYFRKTFETKIFPEVFGNDALCLIRENIEIDVVKENRGI